MAAVDELINSSGVNADTRMMFILDCGPSYVAGGYHREGKGSCVRTLHAKSW